MKIQIPRVVCAVLVAAFLPALPLSAVEEEPSEATLPAEIQAEMEAWMKLAQPGEHHGHLAPFVGTWQGVAKMWMAPDTEPMVEESRAEARWILGERFLQWTHIGDFSGMAFEGMAIEGYNNGDHRYEAVWMDNFGTLILFYTGTCSDDGATREMVTEFMDPINGGSIAYRSVYEWIDADHFKYSAYMDKGEGEFLNMEIEWARQ